MACHNVCIIKKKKVSNKLDDIPLEIPLPSASTTTHAEEEKKQSNQRPPTASRA